MTSPTPAHPRVALYSHFSRKAMPHYVKVYLVELRRHVDRLILLYNDDAPYGDVELLWLEQRSIEARAVPNAGYDFGMWSRMGDLLHSGTVTELCLANDSCVPVRPLDALFAAARHDPADAYAMTDCRQLGVHHMQSYFLVLRPPAIELIAARLAERGIVEGHVQNVIVHHELGLSTALLAAGLRFATAYTARESYSGNPALFDAPTLLQHGAPLLKRRLLQGRLDRSAVKHFVRVWGEYPGTALLRHVPAAEQNQLDWLGNNAAATVAEAAESEESKPQVSIRQFIKHHLGHRPRQWLRPQTNVLGTLDSTSRP